MTRMKGKTIHDLAIAPYRDWAIQAHSETNHYYDDYLPYEFHLRMVANINSEERSIMLKLANHYGFKPVYIEAGLWLHDTVEDARKNYNDIMWLMNPNPETWETPKLLTHVTAEIVRAVTNYGRGRNRDERMPDFVYKDIRETPGAVYVKLRDRTANVQYGKMSRSKMVEKYKKENPHFLASIQCEELEICKPMVEYLDKIFNNEA